MTAEIAIMNKTGVALAADSKATIGAGLKSFDTVNKIFTLSKVHPVGIMIWGNAEFMHYPVEVICKEFRAQRLGRTEPTVQAWADSFIDFLRKFAPVDQDLISGNISYTVASWLDEIENVTIFRARQQKIAAGSVEYVELLKKQLVSWTKRYASHDEVLNESQQNDLLKDFGGAIEVVIQDYFGSHKNDELLDVARQFCMAVLTRDVFSPRSTGFAIAGYGDTQLLPSLVGLETDGYIGKSIKVGKQGVSNISLDMPAVVIPFAQKEMVQRFMDGVDPEYAAFCQGLYRRVLLDNCLEILEKYGADASKTDATKEDIKNAIAKSIQTMGEKIEGFQKEKFSAPILDMVRLLPKDELPHLAESLVALTSLKRHVSHDAETVGGPIDVALISRGDGFIWIKRKHYFKPELNPHFGASYLRGMRGDDDVRRPTSRSGGGAKARRRKAEASNAGEEATPSLDGQARA